ncbi:DegT/DnrJ/EryC1/StrS family aminotransferase [Chloroflexota bacterium]
MEILVPLVDLDFGKEESQAVLDVLNKRWLTMGAVTREFESQFAEISGVKHALAVSNGTMALHLACLILGIGPGDEVILPSLTFVATANALLYTGAEVRFADIIGPNELNISPESIEKQITPRTKALIVMHYGGYPCRMRQIMEIAARNNLAVIEDAAHAPGARLEGRALGTWGDVGCFSFFSNKNLVTGEGGMLVTQRDDLAEKARLLRSHGMTSRTWDRHKGHAYSYDVVELGYNYRIDEMRSALGLVQLSKLDRNNKRRMAITQTYWGALGGSRLGLPFRDLTAKSIKSGAYHIFPVLLPEGVRRNAFMDSLRTAGIQTSIHYPPIHQFSYHRRLVSGVTLPQTERVAEREVTLPLYSSMSDSQVGLVLEAVKGALEGAGAG